MNILTSSVIASCVFAIGASSSMCLAQAFPAKPINIIVPYAAGGTVDAMARLAGSLLTESLGQPVIVDARPGASSIIGMQACAKAVPDGHTMCFTVQDSLSYNPAMFSDLPYNADTDFAPIINLGFANTLIIANVNAPFDTYKEMIAYSKAKPGALNWATWGAASMPDVYLRWIKRQFGVDIVAIPYKGAAQANPAVVSGEAHITYIGFGVAAPFIKAGKWKPIVAIGDRKSRFMPALPTLAEEGGDPGLPTYFAAFAPGATPKPIVDRLNSELAKVLRTSKMQAFLTNYTLEYIENTASQFAEFVKRDRETAGKVFRSIGIYPTAAPQS
jgi:tripartite-type tricarboxylate transporter receptor subunit TctC